MTPRKSISTFISSIAISITLLLTLIPAGTHAKNKTEDVKEDSIPLLRGFAVSVDLVGPAQLILGDYGQYEAALRINLKDKYFPTIELGIGKADHNDDVTSITYKTTAPYGKIGMDFNVLKNKHDIYRFYVGARYAMTSFKYDLSHPVITDPVWGGEASYSAKDVKCSCQWIEALLGVDAKIWGPVHLGWSLRYRSRISHKDGAIGNSWYVPGFGKSGSSNIGGTFSISLDI